jgi:putative flippase GtrA
MTAQHHSFLHNLWSCHTLNRYLVVGGFNTAFGYGVSVALYYALFHQIHIVILGILANIICITEAFILYKLLVFKSSGSWWHEYLRSYVVYGTSAAIGVAGLWMLVDGLDVPFWLAQGGLMFVSVAISFAGHRRFTFKKVGS